MVIVQSKFSKWIEINLIDWIQYGVQMDRYVININNCIDRGRQRGQILSSQHILAQMGNKLTESACYQCDCWFFNVSCISTLQICTIHVINIDNRSNRPSKKVDFTPSIDDLAQIGHKLTESVCNQHDYWVFTYPALALSKPAPFMSST